MLPVRMLGLFLLMALLCDVDSLCPDDLLILDPPEVIGEYGQMVMVNCTSKDEFHDGIYWKEGTNHQEREYENQFTDLGLLLSTWDITPECIVMISKDECRKDLEVTVYKNPDSVNVDPKHENAAVEGKEYELQCNIVNVAPIRKLAVRWYKDNDLIRTDWYNNTNTAPVNETSVLEVNVSRGENGAPFRCEAQLDFGPHGPKPPIVSSTHNITVHYPPEFSNVTSDVVSVDEEDIVNLSCEAEGNPPPRFNWTCDGLSMLEYSDKLKFRVHANTTCTCTATNRLGVITKNINVDVIQKTTIAPSVAVTTPRESAPKDCPLTVTPAEIVVRFGDAASFNCSTSAVDALGMGWEASFAGTGLEAPPSVTWEVERLHEWAVDLKCYISPRNDPQCFVKPALTIYKTPDSVSVSADGPMVENTENLLTCDVISVAPVQNLTVKWYRDSEIVHTQTFDDIIVGPGNVSTNFSVIPERVHNGALFRCSAELHLGPEGPNPVPAASSEPHTAVVHYKPLMQNCSDFYALVEHEHGIDTLPCKADGNPPPTVRWYYQGQQINASEPLTRGRSGQYTAEVGNSLGSSETHVNIQIEYSPSFTCNDNFEVAEGGELQAVQCVPEGVPPPTVTWFKDGKKVDLPQRWTKHHSGKYELRAINKHGRAQHTLHLDVLYAPEFGEGSISKEISPGENVTIDCHAEGNPAPAILWRYNSTENVMETTGGSQSSIVVSGATSTNTGVYVCVATNKVGKVSRSVTLMMKGAQAGEHLLIIIVLACVCSFFLVVILILLNQRRRHGQYSFVPSKAVEESGLPMTQKSDGVHA